MVNEASNNPKRSASNSNCNDEGLDDVPELTQERIQKWIRRIPRHMQQIIEVEGGDIRPYNRTERKERYQRRKAGRRPSGSEIFQIDEVKVDEVEADEEVDEEDW